jgi:tetratricopeptide (TPR) repeat protein
MLRNAYLQYEGEPGLKGVLAARQLCEEALKLDPAYMPAFLCVGSLIERQIEVGPSADHARLIQELGDISSRAITADRDDPRAWNLRAEALFRQFRWDGAFAANSEALRIDPYQSGTIAHRARLLVFNGKPAEALPLLEQVIALNPRDPEVFVAFGLACRSHLMLGRYDDAIVACEKAVALQDLWPYYLYLTAAYAQKGDMAKVASAKIHLLKLLPAVSIARVKALRLSDVPEFWQQTETHVFAGLRKAGIPEQ